MAEGVPLLRVYLGNWIEGSNPSLSAIRKKPGFTPGFLRMAERVCEEEPLFDKLRCKLDAEGAPQG